MCVHMLHTRANKHMCITVIWSDFKSTISLQVTAKKAADDDGCDRPKCHYNFSREKQPIKFDRILRTAIQSQQHLLK